MLGKTDELLEADEGMAIAPLIDVVFLLLIYFMVATSLKKPEADISITLPGTVQQSTSVKTPDETIIEISEEGVVSINNTTFGQIGQRELPDLEAMLVRYREASDAAQNLAMVTIQAAGKTLHGRVIDVMNACAGAGIKGVTVGMSDE